MKKILYSLFFLCTAIKAQTQLFTMQDGLSNKEITCLLQTHSGFLWIGTANGLNLYDGYSFHELNRHNGLTNGKIICLWEDRKGLLWIGTWEGLNILNQKTGEIKQFFTQKGRKREVLNSEITCIEEMPDGVILVTVGDGSVMRFKSDDAYEKVYVLPNPGRINDQARFISVFADSSVCILNNYDVVKRLKKDFTEDHGFQKEARDILFICPTKDKKQLILLDTWGNLTWASVQTGHTIKTIQSPKQYLKPEPVTAFGLCDKNRAWFAFGDGSLWLTDLATEKSTEYTSELNHLLTGLPTCICQDRNGIVWLGSNYGLIKFCPKKHYFENYMFTQNGGYRAWNSIRGIIEDAQGDIYIGGYNGLFKMASGSDSVRRIEVKGATEALQKKAYYPYRLVDDGQYLWAATEAMGFYRFNKATSAIEFPIHQKYFSKAFALLQDGDTLWIGTHNGLFIYNKRLNTMRKYGNPKDEFDISRVEVTELVHDASGNTWIGTYSSGIFKMQGNAGIVQRISNADTPYPINFITTLFFENDTVLWAGTRGAGLGKINTRSGKIIVYTKKNGLADNSVAGIVKDNSGILWISTFNGLSRFDNRSGIFENYYDKDGLTDNEFNTVAYLKTTSGKIYMGGLNGINGFYPDSLNKNKKQAPRIFLTHFTKYNGNTDKLEENILGLSEKKESHFAHKDKFFSFSFTLDDYYRPLRSTFFYKLEGYDNAWNNIGTQHTIRFNGLPAGNYQLKIKGVNSEGLASVNELLIPISVSLAFYNTWWFYLLLFLITVAVVYTITRYRIYQSLKIRKLRTKISSDLHDEVGSLLTRISVQVELIKQGISQNDTMQEVSRIADTSRMATAAMSDVLWSIDARNDKMGNLVDRLREQAGETLFPMDIEVNFEVKNIDLTKEIDGLLRQNLFLIFKEAINNIAKHAKASRVNILLENRHNQFVMMIEDNGPGVNKTGAPAKQGQGLRNMKMRAELFEGSLEIAEHNGYRIILRLKKFA